MADINLKSATPDTTITTSAFLFGADSQSAAAPSVYAVSTVRDAILGNIPTNAAASQVITAPALGAL